MELPPDWEISSAHLCLTLSIAAEIDGTSESWNACFCRLAITAAWIIAKQPIRHAQIARAINDRLVARIVIEQEKTRTIRCRQHPMTSETLKLSVCCNRATRRMSQGYGNLKCHFNRLFTIFASCIAPHESRSKARFQKHRVVALDKSLTAYWPY